MRKQDLVGLQFGKLSVLRREGSNRRGISTWLCRCECGGEKVSDADSLKRGRTSSCGCLAAQQRKEAAQRPPAEIGRTTKRKEYDAWSGMIRRCYDPNHPSFERYNARGVEVCDKWRESFAAFYADMGNAPKGTTLDRIDNDLGYSKENCRWADMAVQGNNRSNNLHVTFNGRTMTISQWSREVGINYGALRARVVAGWSAERALTQKPNRRIQSHSN